MPLKVWNGSSWQVQAQIKVWNGSSWVALNAIDNAKTARVWNGSSWVQFHPGVRLNSSGFTPGSISLNAQDLTFSPISAYAEAKITLNHSNGTAYYEATGFITESYSWLLTGANSDYYAYMDSPSGSSFTSGTVGSSIQLNTSPVWTLAASQGSVGFDYKTLTSVLRIKNSAGTDIVAIDVNMEALAEMQP
jgi:hypothetical protein